MLKAVKYNLVNLGNFRGSDTRGQFWPYAGFVIVLAVIGMMLVMLPAMAESMIRMQRFAAEHPELATVQSGPGSYSISIEGNHPELMPDMGGMMAKMNIVIIAAIMLLAAAVARRLHDRGKPAYWGILPLPFLLFASFAMPKAFAQNPPDMGLFLTIFVNNALYLAALVTLVVMLAGAPASTTTRSNGSPRV